MLGHGLLRYLYCELPTFQTVFCKCICTLRANEGKSEPKTSICTLRANEGKSEPKTIVNCSFYAIFSLTVKFRHTVRKANVQKKEKNKLKFVEIPRFSFKSQNIERFLQTIQAQFLNYLGVHRAWGYFK